MVERAEHPLPPERNVRQTPILSLAATAPRWVPHRQRRSALCSRYPRAVLDLAQQVERGGDDRAVPSSSTVPWAPP